MHVEQRVDHTLAIADHPDIEVSRSEGFEPGTGWHHALSDVQSDFAPVVDDPVGIVFVRLVDVTVEQFEAKPFGPRLFQQTPCLGPRFFDVGPPPGDLLQFRLGRGQRRSGEDDPADGVDVGDLGELRRRVPTVDRQGQRSAHADIVERFFLVVDLDKAAAVPVAGLHRDFVAELLLQLVDHRRRITAELDRRPVAADRVELHHLLGGIDADKAVEIRQTLMIVIWVPNSFYRLANLIFDEFERAGAHDVLLVPAGILVENLLFIDPRIGIGERRQKCIRRELQVEDDGRRIGRRNRVDHHVVALARAQDTFGRKDDLVPARRHVGRGQRRPVVELHALADRESVGLVAVCRLRHHRAQIANQVGGRRRVVRIDPDQHAVERGRGMDRCKGGLAMRVEARRCVRRDHVGQGAAIFWRLFLCSKNSRRKHGGDRQRRQS